jgi:hypothetical protein
MSQDGSAGQRRRKKNVFLAWPLIRKLESLAFLAMFIAVPFFGYRVVDYTSRHLALKNAAHDLVKDIRKAKQMAAELGIDIAVESRQASEGKNAAYVIKSGSRTLEEVVLPEGVSMIGGITFSKEGVPDRPATFDVHMDTRSLAIDVDSQGLVTLP